MKKRQSRFLKALTIAIAFIANYSSAFAQTPIGYEGAEMPVSYDVSSTGAFQYTLPLRLPPGIKDMVPNLSVSYNSQSGNGTMGIGWSLTGLSAITRGMPTLFHHANISPVGVGPGDVLFLDGQQINKTGPSTTLYLTEVKNFAKIEEHGTAGNGPSYFTVEHPNGLTYEYGNSVSSKMLAQGKSEVLVWAINKIVDKYNNTIVFEYDNQQANGIYKITKITYAANSGTSNDQPVEINFNYISTRQDKNAAWVVGAKIAMEDLLEDIVIKFSNGSTANKYHFTYDASSYSRLTKIEEIIGQFGESFENKLPPINITWGTNPNSGFNAYLSPNLSNGIDPDKVSHGDFNGDGFPDFIEQNGGTSTLYLNNGDGNFTKSTAANVPTVVNAYWNGVPARYGSNMYFDYNGDGMDDAIVIQRFITPFPNPWRVYYKIYVHLANGNSTVFNSGILVHEGGTDDQDGNRFNELTHILVGNFDGDAKQEMIIAQPYNFHNNNSVEDYEFFVVGDEYGSHQIFHFGHGHIDGGMVMDYNGDGKDEFLFTHILLGNTPSAFLYGLDVSYNSSTLKPILNQTSTQWPIIHYSTGQHPFTLSTNYIGDFNGDGNDDLLTWDIVNAKWILKYSNATYNAYTNNALTFESKLPSGFPAPGFPLYGLHIIGPAQMFNGQVAYYTGYTIKIADFNGDGMDDILELTPAVPQGPGKLYNIFFSKGIGFVHEQGNYGWETDNKYNIVGDYNGDGQADLLYLHPNGGAIIHTFKDNITQKVISIEHAEKNLNISYNTLPSDPDYQRSVLNNSNYSTKILPLKVVKSLKDGVTLSGDELHNKYKYTGLVYHKYGLGLRGFETFTVENKTGQKTSYKYEVATRIPYLKEKRIFDQACSQHNSSPETSFGKRIKYAQYDKNGGANGLSRNVYHYESEIHDYINGGLTINTVDLGNTLPGSIFYDHGQIASKTSTVNNIASETINYTYDVNAPAINRGKPTRISKTNGYLAPRHVDYTYNSLGDINTKISDPGTLNENTTTYTYNSTYGNLEKTSLVAAGVTGGAIENETIYSPDGRFVETTKNAQLHIATNYYGTLATSWGKVITHTAEDGIQTEYEYDLMNRLVKTKDVASGIEQFTQYRWVIGGNTPETDLLPNARLLISTHTDGLKDGISTVYDKYDRVIRKVTNEVPTMLYHDFNYNSAGLLSSTTSPYEPSQLFRAVITSYQYDCYNQLSETSVSDGGVTIQTTHDFAYNGTSINKITTENNLATGLSTVTTKGAYGITDIETYSDAGHSNQVGSIQYAYHPAGMPSYVNVNGIVADYGYDGFYRLQIKAEPNAGTTSYTYNALSQLIQENQPNGVSYTYTYDKLGHVTAKTSGGQSYNYSYNTNSGQPSTGKLLQMSAPNGSLIKYTYNNRGLVRKIEEELDPLNKFTTEYTYDAWGRKITQKYPTGDIIGFEYMDHDYVDKITLVSATGLQPQVLWRLQHTDRLGRIEVEHNYNSPSVGGIPVYETHYTYDNKHFGILASQTTTASGMPISDMQYNFDPATGNLMSRTDNLSTRGFTEFFTYDLPNDRLTDVQYSGSWASPLAMSYDVHGNILKKSDISNSTHDWKYQQYALKQVPEPHTSMPAYELPYVTQHTTYEPFMKVSTVVEENVNKFAFTYGADQERIKCDYYDMPGNILRKTKYYATNYEKIVDAATGDVEHISYIWGAGKPVAMLRHKVSANPLNNSSEINHILTDYQGSITHILDNDGMSPNTGVLDERSYDAWGRPRDVNNWVPYTSHQPFNNWLTDRGYTGHEHVFSPLWNNNVINMNGRIYDPLVGRMFSPDPYVPDASSTVDYNKYVYARNNPLKYTDPTGEFWHIVAGAVIGGAINTFTHWDDIVASGQIDWGKAGAAFGIGATAGALTAATGGAALAAAAPTSVVGYAAAGSMSAAIGTSYGAIVKSYGNSAVFGDPLMDMDDFYTEVGFSAVTAGLTSGISAHLNGLPLFDTKASVEFSKPVITRFGDRDVIAPQTTSQNHTRVGRWMSRKEYNIMKNTGQMVEGAGGGTSVGIGGPNAFTPATKGSVYVEFDVPTSSLIQGGRENWLKVVGPNAGRAMQTRVLKQGGTLLPKIANLSEVLLTK